MIFNLFCIFLIGYTFSKGNAFDYFSKDCCQAVENHMGRLICQDGEYAPFFGSCCGKGKCNMACCNCDNGCRGDKHSSISGPIFGSIQPNIGLTNPFSSATGLIGTGDLVKDQALAIGSAVWQNKELLTNNLPKPVLS